MTQNVSKIKHVNQTIVIIGDSHGRKCAAELKHRLGSTFAISSFVKPGAGMRAVLDTMQADIKKLKRNDVVVIWGGCNDIGRNNSREALNHLCKFVEKNQKVNTVVMTAPPRYDFLPSSCVNNEVTNFNRQLKKRMIPYKNVQILETGLERECFTKHGMHLNSPGKESIAQRLAIVVRSFLKKEKVSPISLDWKNDTPSSDPKGNGSHTASCIAVTAPHSSPSTSTEESLVSEAQDSAASTNKRNEDETKTAHFQLTKRQRKKPALRNQDFLWTM